VRNALLAGVPGGQRTVPKRADRCGALWHPDSRLVQPLWRCGEAPAAWPDRHGKEGVDGYERTFGYPLRELLSRPFLETVHPEDRPSVREKFGELVHGDSDDVSGFENRVICGDGSVGWIQWNSQTMPERGLIFAVGRDVTDRRRADAALREAQRMVEASRDELAASRARIVAAADEERRRVVRDLHDGPSSASSTL
jgi:PAS domain S-box-containing protein